MPDRQTLRIEFHGICTHFHDNVLPSIPHRVVIPDGTPKRRGMLALTGETGDWHDYELEPHRTTITMENVDFTRQGLIDQNELFTRSALRIENVVGDPIEYDPSFGDAVRSLSEFVDTFTYATSVVLEGRAAAYFDFHSGVRFSAYKEGEEVRVRADVETHGTPRLRITAFSGGDPQGRTHVFELTDTSKTLVIANLATDEAYTRNDGKYDYTLHFLTERGGIPRFFKEALPGMAKAGSDLDAACSDSRYP